MSIFSLTYLLVDSSNFQDPIHSTANETELNYMPLMRQEFEKMKEKAPDNFRLDFAVSREQTNEKGEKMYIQTRMAQYAEELWELLKKDNTYVYMCGLKGMEKGIDDIMLSLAAKDGKKRLCNCINVPISCRKLISYRSQSLLYFFPSNLSRNITKV